MPKILVVDDEENIRKVLSGLLKKNGYTSVLTAADGIKALEIVNDDNIDLIISDIEMPAMDGLELFLKVKDTGIPFIILTAYGTIETAVNATKNGVYDFIAKPFDEKNLIDTVNKALREYGRNGLEISPGSIDELFFASTNEKIARIKENMNRVVNTRAGILILGETGTGKGLLANILHYLSPEKERPFIKINCSAIPENLIESELFGSMKGAFTGAVTDKPGKFETADGGTIFLDEIGELRMDLQVKLLSVIQEKELTRLGENKARKIDVRIIAATNIDIHAAIAEKKFREDLYYRLNVVEFTLPPLRERKDDILSITEYFTEKYSKEYSLQKKSFDPGARELLCGYRWPGNIRELENVIQKMLIMEKENVITEDVLKNYIKMADTAFEDAGASMIDAGKNERAKKEAELIKDALMKTDNNKTKAAELLGISRRMLLYRIKEYGI
jgi:DNA-binding NtrC family response regulator